jgi:hypothetical protein
VNQRAVGRVEMAGAERSATAGAPRNVIPDEGARMTTQLRPRAMKHGRPPLSRRGAIAALLLGALACGTAAAAGVPARLTLGAATQMRQPTFQGFYDGHKDTYLITDVSSKAQAKALKINDAPILAAVKAQPAMYFVQGRAAPGQLPVFGSEPGEKDYSPLWTEVIVTWKSGRRPVLLVRDDQVKSLAKKGQLTATTTRVINNAPIIKVGKGG